MAESEKLKTLKLNPLSSQRSSAEQLNSPGTHPSTNGSGILRLAWMGANPSKVKNYISLS
jgi:hypothetical protein